MRDGRIVSNHGDVPERAARSGRGRSGARGCSAARGAAWRTWSVLKAGPAGTNATGSVPLPPDHRGSGAVLVSGELVGRVAVFAGPPLARIARQLGPRMAVVAVGVLAVGMTLIALFVFGPTRRRLRDVQSATERLGAGDLSARAPEDGGDEVASVARSFNRMADELAESGPCARGIGPRSPAAARRRVTRIDDPAHRHPRLRRDAQDERARIDAPTRTRYLGIVEEETHRLERIIGDLLDLARLEGGGGTIRREQVSVQSLFDRVRARHERESLARDIRIAFDVAGWRRVSSKAIPIASSRRCRTSPPTRCGTRPSTAPSRFRQRWKAVRASERA